MKWLLYSLLLFSSLACASDLDVTVDGPNRQEVYTVQGYFEVSASTDVTWKVLTDYDHMSEFLPAITTSTVKQREPEFLLVRQTFVAKYLFFNHSANALFEIVLIPNMGVINFTDILHDDFIKCEGIWSVIPTSEGAGVIYRVEIIPSIDAPHWVIRNVSHKMAVTLLHQLQQEVERRALLVL